MSNCVCLPKDATIELIDANLGEKTITENGHYLASSDGLDGYSAVDVNVSQSFTQEDEGKVVSNGALVVQTAHADVTPTISDQTIDTTTNNSIKVKGDADLVAGNIKKDVEIFGVTGSYEGGGGGGQNIIEMHNVYGSATKWNSPEFENTFSDGGYLEVDVDLSQQATGLYAHIISVGSRTVISTWSNTAVSHVYFNSDTNEISFSQNRVATTFTILDTSVPHTIKVDKDYFYVDGNSVVALQSGVLAQQRLMIGSSEGNVRFTGEYKSIILK